MRETRPTATLEANKSERTRNTVGRILRASREIFTRDGHAGLSLRKVADEAGIAVGNLTYHFPTKTELLDAMLKEALADYVEAHLEQFQPERDAPMEILLNVVEFYVRNARASHGFFYQLWGFAGSSAEAREMVRGLYQPIGRFVYYLVRAANPKLNDVQVRRAVLQIFALEEGYKLFIGMGPEDSSAIAAAETDIRELTRRIIETA
ncbi:MAG: TetR/AcrR family transcriptional regulator [Parvularculaceae bacterium]